MSKSLVRGVGINDLGWSDNSSNISRKWIYQEWHGMLSRCYSTRFQQKCPTYIGCTVCERWLTFSNFVADAPLLPGFYKVIDNNFRGINLDKDSRVLGNKEYGPDTCCWLTKAENNHERHIRCGTPIDQGRPVVAISPDGVATEYSSATECARHFCLDKSTIQQACASGCYRSGVWYSRSHFISRGKLRGWSFYWKDEYTPA